MEQELSKGDVKDVLREHFPKVYWRALRYEDLLADLSSSGNVDMSLEHSLNGFIIALYAVVKFYVKNLRAQEKVEKVRRGIGAITEALSEIDKFEAGRAEFKG